MTLLKQNLPYSRRNRLFKGGDRSSRMGCFARARATVTHVLYITFSIAIFIRLGEILQHESTYKEGWTIAAGVLLNIVHFALQIILLLFYIHRYNFNLINCVIKSSSSWNNKCLILLLGGKYLMSGSNLYPKKNQHISYNKCLLKWKFFVRANLKAYCYWNRDSSVYLSN